MVASEFATVQSPWLTPGQREARLDGFPVMSSKSTLYFLPF